MRPAGDSVALQLKLMVIPTSRTAIAAMLLSFAATSLPGQLKHEPVELTLSTNRNWVGRGQSFEAALTAHIEDGWHLYSMEPMPNGPTATRIDLPPGQPFQMTANIIAPDPLVAFDPNFQMNVEYYETEATFRIPVKTPSDARSGKQRLTVEVVFQTCNDHTCLPPTKVSVATLVMIARASESTPSRGTNVQSAATNAGRTAAAGQPTPQVNSSSEGAATRAQSAQPGKASIALPDRSGGTSSMGKGGLASFLWFAVLMGALSLLTPCVFPMVPITVSYFSNHGSQTRRGAVLQASSYGVGIVLTFSALGLALALIFGAGGVNQLAANPWINLLITAIFFAFAFSLFGAYFVQVPPGLMNRIDSLTRSQKGSRVVGALLMGFTFTLTSFTCTAPFVGTLLVMAAHGNWRWPLAGMLAYSTVFALPFLVLALAPQLLSQLPRAGPWMNSIKVVMGFLEIAAAMKFLSNADLVWHWGIFTRETVLAVWIACGVAIVLYVFGLVRFEHDSRLEHVGPLRLSIALAFLAVTVALVPGLFRKPLGELDSFLPPSSAELGGGTQVAQAASGEVQWILNDYERARDQATREQKLVFIDFTGYTCTNCRWMEANMFPRPEVKSELEKFVTVRLYTDGKGELYEKQQRMQQEKFGTVALPLYAVVRPDGKCLATFPGLTRNSTEFVTFLRAGFSSANGD